jgi:hypothetical protein
MYGVMAGVRLDDGEFVKGLYRAGVGDLIKEAVGPEPD